MTIEITKHGPDPAKLAELAGSLEGEVIGVADAAYDEARAVWNGMIDRRPAAIARCAGPDDVVAAIGFARDRELPIAVRGGGHNVAGQAVCDGGLVVDLSTMRSVEVDPDRRTVRAEGGCTLGDVDRATQEHGLAAPLGVVTGTGIAGLTLSGGLGWLRRLHGLSCDNLLAAEVVTADGARLTASADENADLFWALRGGGGNFGVVTSFTYRLHPVGPDVHLSLVLYPLDSANRVLEGCERYLESGPEEASPLVMLGRAPEADEVPAERWSEPCAIVVCVHPGDPAIGERALAPLRELAEPLADLSGTLPYVEVQGAFDEDYPDGGRYYWKSINVPALDAGVVERLVEATRAAPSAESTIDIWCQGGAIARVGEAETAFAGRAAPYLVGIEANWHDESTSDANVAWVREAIADLRSHSGEGIYLNFPGFLEEGDGLVREAYGPNYPRLAEVKAAYDPANVFRLNANIEPAG